MYNGKLVEIPLEQPQKSAQKRVRVFRRSLVTGPQKQVRFTALRAPGAARRNGYAAETGTLRQHGTRFSGRRRNRYGFRLRNAESGTPGVQCARWQIGK
jgi:hypothetical protein